MLQTFHNMLQTFHNMLQTFQGQIKSKARRDVGAVYIQIALNQMYTYCTDSNISFLECHSTVKYLEYFAHMYCCDHRQRHGLETLVNTT